MTDAGSVPRRRILVPALTSAEAARPILGRDRLVHVHGETMGTTWSIKLYAASSACTPEVRKAVQDALDHVVAEMSPWVAQSALSLFNAASAGSWHVLPQNFFGVLSTALSIAADCGGAFDPTVGALVNAWGFGPNAVSPRVPPPRDIQRLMMQCGWSRLDIDSARRAVRQPGGLHLDLCGIAKGFGVDQAARVLRRLGIRDFLIDVGGELRGEGVKPDGTPWWVALEEPRLIDDVNADTADAVVALHGLSIATSGDYRRFFEIDGRRHAHTIDPRTGQTVDNGIAAVTVLHKSCMEADAFATAMMVLGAENAFAFATRHRLAARLIERRDGRTTEITTPAFDDLLDPDDHLHVGSAAASA